MEPLRNYITALGETLWMIIYHLNVHADLGSRFPRSLHILSFILYALKFVGLAIEFEVWKTESHCVVKEGPEYEVFLTVLQINKELQGHGY